MEMAACVDLLPLLARTLESVAHQVETAVADVCGHFDEILRLGRYRMKPCQEMDSQETRPHPSTEDDTHFGRVVDSVMTRLQFQDAVSQRIAQVTTLLRDLHAAMDARQNGHINRTDWVARLAVLSNVFEERDGHLSTSAPANDENGSVILF